MADQDLYATLGVSRDASDDDIRKAYRKQARKHHPDLNPGDAGAEARFKELSAAFEVLTNSEKRALYDEFGADAEKIGYDPERAEEYRQWKQRAERSRGFDGGGGGFGFQGDPADIEDLLSELFRRSGAGAPPPRRGGDAEASLSVSFLDAARGATKSLELSRVDATGRPETVRLNVNIPAGIESGQRLRLSGQGGPGHRGAERGDLYVRIEIEPHAHFERSGRDILLTLPVTVPEALRGAEVEVPTLKGSGKLKVPAGAQGGQRLRLRGQGIAPKKGEPGDMIVTLEIVMPTGGDEAERARIAEAMEPLYQGNDPRGGLR